MFGLYISVSQFRAVKPSSIGSEQDGVVRQAYRSGSFCQFCFRITVYAISEGKHTTTTNIITRNITLIEIDKLSDLRHLSCTKHHLAPHELTNENRRTMTRVLCVSVSLARSAIILLSLFLYMSVTISIVTGVLLLLYNIVCVI